MIVGLVSSWREGALVQLAVESALAGCDRVLVVDAPIAAGGASSGEPSDFSAFRKGKGLVQRLSLMQAGVNFRTSPPFGSDARKRTYMVERAKASYDDGVQELWGVWIDGDERLMFPEMLRHYCARGAYTGNPNFPLRLVEAQGGSVSLCWGKVVRLDLIERYVASSYEVQLKGEPLTRAWGNDNAHWNWRDGGNVEGARPPVQGEPHLLHLSALRPPERSEERMHQAEADDLERRIPPGLVLP